MTELPVGSRPLAALKPRRGGDRRDRIFAVLLPVATFAIFALAWQLFANHIDNFLIPDFKDTVTQLAAQVADGGAIWKALWTTNQALIAGFGIAAIVGVPVGLATARSTLLSNVVDPYLDILLAVPIAPLMPLVLMALGLGLPARAAVVILFAIVVIIVNTRAGVRGVDPTLIEMARSFGASEARIWRRILLPAAGPSILTGLRLGLGRAVDGMVVVELLLVSVGVGKLILEYKADYDSASVFATILVVAVESAVLLSLVQLLERRVRGKQVGSND